MHPWEGMEGYRAYGLTLASDLPLPELDRGDPLEASLHVAVGSPMEVVVDGRVLGGPGGPMTVQRSPSGVRLHFDESADFLVSAGYDEIEVRAAPGTAASTVRHLLIDHVLPVALSAQGELVLHASGVALPSGAALFVGRSGAGKSTLAAELSRQGAPVLCDDGARIVWDGRRPAVVSSYPGLRLWPEALGALAQPTETLAEVAGGSRKRRWVPADQPTSPVPLACVFVLDDGDGRPESLPMAAREALVELLEHAYRLSGIDRIHAEAQFDRAAALVGSTPVHRLSYPYDFAGLDQAAELVVEVVATATARPN